MPYYKSNGLELSHGNLKLGKDTLIFNMGTAADCPSAKLGLCKLGRKCYALKAERLYKGCTPYRERQAKYWQEVTASQFVADFTAIMKRHSKALQAVKYLRINESGDFYGQSCIDKLDAIARDLSLCFGITVYTYTARQDLNFDKAFYFHVKGSGHLKGNNGKTIAMPKKAITAAMVNHHEIVKQEERKGSIQNILYRVCPMDCRGCNICKERNHLNVVFPLH